MGWFVWAPFSLGGFWVDLVVLPGKPATWVPISGFTKVVQLGLVLLGWCGMGVQLGLWQCAVGCGRDFLGGFSWGHWGLGWLSWTIVQLGLCGCCGLVGILSRACVQLGLSTGGDFFGWCFWRWGMGRFN